MKRKIIAIGLAAIFPIVFNLIYFNIITTHTPSRWICWGFIHGTYLVMVGAYTLLDEKGSGGVFGYPRIFVTKAFYVVNLLACLLFILINPGSYIVTLIFLMIVAGFYLHAIFFYLLTDDATRRGERIDRENKYFIKKCSLRLKMAMDHIHPTDATRKIVEKAYDAIQSARVTSIPEALSLEDDIITNIGTIEIAAKEKRFGQIPDLVNKLKALINERDMTIQQSTKA